MKPFLLTIILCATDCATVQPTPTQSACLSAIEYICNHENPKDQAAFVACRDAKVCRCLPCKVAK